MHGWYPMSKYESESMAAVGCWAFVVLPIAAAVIVWAAAVLHG